MPSLPLPQGKPLDVPRTMHQALELHHQGRIAEAEPLYAAVLAARPDHFDALQMLGVIKLARGELATALRLVSAAMQLRPKSPQVLLNLRPRSQRHEPPRGGAGELRRGAQAQGPLCRGAQQPRQRAGRARTQRGGAGQLQARHRDQAGLCGGVLQPGQRAAGARPPRRGAQELRPRHRAARQLRQGALQPRLGAGHPRPAGRCAGLLRPRAGDRAGFAEAHAQPLRRAARAQAHRRGAARPGPAAGRPPGLCRGALHARHADGGLQPPRRCGGELREGGGAEARLQQGALGVVQAALPILYADESADRRRSAPNTSGGCGRCAPTTRRDAFPATCPRASAWRSRSSSPTRATTTAICRRCSAASPRGSWPTATARPRSRRRRRRASRSASASSAASSTSIRSGRSASGAGSPQLDRERFQVFGYHTGSKQDAETEIARTAMPALRAGAALDSNAGGRPSWPTGRTS